MPIKAFPPLERADKHGLLAIGGDLSVSSLLLAYRSGIFPWPVEEPYLTWFAPPRRAVLFLRNLHISKSLRKERRRRPWCFEIDRDFERIIAACRELINRGEQNGTWITPRMEQAYTRLHKAGHVHCLGSYLDHELAGGLYGVSIGRMFAAESMFYRKPNASKLALWRTAEWLAAQGAAWIDCQVMTSLLKRFGAVEVPRDEFMAMLAEALNGPEIKWRAE